MKKYLLLACVTIVTIQSSAQDENFKNITGKNQGSSMLYTSVESSTTSYINTKTNDSNAVLMYLSPSIDYYHKSGIGLKAKTYLFTGGSDPGFILSSFSAYYAKYTGSLYPYLSYTRFISHNNPSVPYSPIQNDIYTHLRFKLKPVTLLGGFDYSFGTDKENNDDPVSDINAFFGASKIIQTNLGNNTSLAVVPALVLNAGTDRYFKYTRSARYISQNKTIKGLKYGNNNSQENGNSGNNNQTYDPVITIENNFTISYLELNLYNVLFIGNFTIEPSGSLYFPMRNNNEVTGYWMLTFGYYLD